MTDQQLQSDLERLRAEVNALGKDNPAAQQKLNSLISDIEEKLEASDLKDDNEGLIDNLKDSIHHFETEHPRATAILNDIMVTLSNMGI